MNTEEVLFAWIMFCVFLAMILFVLFGRITVRKLRKSLRTKDELGTDLVSGLSCFCKQVLVKN